MANGTGEGAGREPALSVVTATPDGLGRLRRLLRDLSAQTIADRLELLVVAPEGVSVDGAAELEALGSHRVVRVPVVDDVDRVLAEGVRAARAPVVALIEDHAYPAPGWAEALVGAHAGPWGAVGAAFDNANPGSRLSWANFLIAYGQWARGADGAGREAPSVSRHNSSFKRDVLLAYGDELGARLVRSGNLITDLRSRGVALFLEPRARVAHVNPSRLRSTLRLRFNSGRLAAAGRVKREEWSRGRVLLNVAAVPVLPALRLAWLARALDARSGVRAALVRALPALALALAVDAAGQATGFVAGPGRSEDTLRTFELDRRAQVRRADLRVLAP